MDYPAIMYVHNQSHMRSLQLFLSLRVYFRSCAYHYESIFQHQSWEKAPNSAAQRKLNQHTVHAFSAACNAVSVPDYQVVHFIYLIAQFFVVFEQGPLLEVVEVRNSRGQEMGHCRVSGYSGPMRYVTFSFSLAICCSSSCVCQNKSRMHINLGEQQYLCYRLMQ